MCLHKCLRLRTGPRNTPYFGAAQSYEVVFNLFYLAFSFYDMYVDWSVAVRIELEDESKYDKTVGITASVFVVLQIKQIFVRYKSLFLSL